MWLTNKTRSVNSYKKLHLISLYYYKRSLHHKMLFASTRFPPSLEGKFLFFLIPEECLEVFYVPLIFFAFSSPS